MWCYVHGHSAGGTNPSLVEAMHFGKPVLAFDCNFNRSTTENNALFFSDANSLRTHFETLDEAVSKQVGALMLEVAKRRYTWQVVANEYFDLLH
jgi:glycosyltransferase involved in cell wall biosynthesis